MRAYDPVQKTTRETDENDVVLNGIVVGRDPDPNIRASILREAMEAGSGGGGAAAAN